VGPDSEVWRVWRERTLLLSGPAAVLLQLAHPLITAGVAAHRNFRADPLRRLRAVLDTGVCDLDTSGAIGRPKPP
jgi:uncharacterized protein (DUF2236 family)